MKTESLRNYFNEIKEVTGGNTSSNSDIIDYQNGFSISINEIEDEYYRYKDLEEAIDDYIDDEDLDSVSDADEIKKHFTDTIDEDLFLFNQGYLKDFTDYMITKIEKRIQ